MRTAILSLVGLTIVLVSITADAQAPAPTDHHKQLQTLVGEWVGTIKSHAPGMPSEPMAASETVEAFGPFWIQSRFKCDFMGMTYEGMGGVGYDPATKKYKGTWMDTMAPHLSIMEGTKDPKTGVLTMNWKSPDPATGKMVSNRSEMKHEGDSYVTEFFVEKDGKWLKNMTIDMKRKAPKTKSAAK